MDTSLTKICAQCNGPKPIDEYGKTGAGKFCLECKETRRHLAHQRSQRKHPETHRRSAQNYANRHPQKRAQTMRQWRQKNVEHCAAYRATYEAEHLEEGRARSRIYHYAHVQEKAANLTRWLKANPHKRKLYNMRRYARKAGLPATMTEAEVTYLRQYWHYACAVCGREDGLFGVKLVLDHWIPLASPDCPGTVATNIVLLCHGTGGCNNSKIHCPPLRWLTRRYGPRKAQQILGKIEAYFAVAQERMTRSCADMA